MEEMLGLMVAIRGLRVVWRSVLTTPGAQYVMIDGMLMMQEWFADSWDYLWQVCFSPFICI